MSPSEVWFSSLRIVSLIALVAVDAVQRIGERFDDRRRRERISGGFQVGPSQQVADAAVELAQARSRTGSPRRARCCPRAPIRPSPLVSTSVSFFASTLAKSALVSTLAAACARRPCWRRCRSKSAISLARSLCSTARASRHSACSSRTSDRSARAMRRSPTRSSMDVNDSNKPMNGQVPAVAESSGHFLGHLTPVCDRPLAGGRRSVHADLVLSWCCCATRSPGRLASGPTSTADPENAASYCITRGFAVPMRLNGHLSPGKLRPGLFQAFVRHRERPS